jgi:hypothetical protein
MDNLDMAGVPKDKGRGHWMQISHGRIFYPLDPSPKDVFIEDIAKGLAGQNRYNGLSDQLINVAQHSCNAAWIAQLSGSDHNVELAMLMHDAPEYVVGDMIRPLKVKMSDFQAAENHVMDAITERYDLPPISHKTIKYYDNLAAAWEKRDIYPSSREWPGLPDCPNWCPYLEVWTPQYAEARFLTLFRWLMYETGRGALL